SFQSRTLLHFLFSKPSTILSGSSRLIQLTARRFLHHHLIQLTHPRLLNRLRILDNNSAPLFRRPPRPPLRAGSKDMPPGGRLVSGTIPDSSGRGRSGVATGFKYFVCTFYIHKSSKSFIASYPTQFLIIIVVLNHELIR